MWELWNFLCCESRDAENGGRDEVSTCRSRCLCLEVFKQESQQECFLRRLAEPEAGVCGEAELSSSTDRKNLSLEG